MGTARGARSGLPALLLAVLGLAALLANGPLPCPLADAARLLKQAGGVGAGAAAPDDEALGSVVPGRFLVKLRPRTSSSDAATPSIAARSATRAGVQSRAKRIVKKLSFKARVKLLREFKTAWDGFSLHTEDINSTLAALEHEYEVLCVYPVVRRRLRLGAPATVACCTLLPSAHRWCPTLPDDRSPRCLHRCGCPPRTRP
jgi:hypothetical protein